MSDPGQDKYNFSEIEMESKMMTPENSNYNFHGVRNTIGEGGHGDTGVVNTVKIKETKDELGEEWTTTKVTVGGGKSARAPFARSTKKTKSSPPDIGSKSKGHSHAELSPPFECGICFGPLMEATFVSCGHMFCKECILKCKERMNSCPICRGVLGSLSRAYEVEKMMEGYFTHTAPEDERLLYLEAKEKRIGGLMKDIASRKKRRFRWIREEWGLLCFRFRSKGILRGTTATLRRMFPFRTLALRRPRLLTNGRVLLITGLIMFVLGRFSVFEENAVVKWVNFWWNHILTGIYMYNHNDTDIIPSPLPPPPSIPKTPIIDESSTLFGSLRKFFGSKF